MVMSTHPECVSYSFRVRACLIVTVHGMDPFQCADPLRPARRSTYRSSWIIPLTKLSTTFGMLAQYALSAEIPVQIGSSSIVPSLSM